jgi:hypothetical protein
LFGETDPVYVQVKNIGKDPDVVEDFDEAVVAISQSSDYIYLDLKETGADTQIFRNSIADRGELLYLSTEDKDDYPVTVAPDEIKVINEEVLYFYLSIPPGNTFNYKWSEDVMVDRAEVGTEWQELYKTYCSCIPRVWNIATYRFGEQLFYNIGGTPGLEWFKDPNFKNADYYSKWEHWHEDTDSTHADAVDLTSWSGHNNYMGDGWHFFNEFILFPCLRLLPDDTNLGDSDADWVIFDTCLSLYASLEDMKNQLLTDGRCAHMFLGFWNTARWQWPDQGEYFADRLDEGKSIKQAWFLYCKDRQWSGTYVRVFYAVDCNDESLAGPGPIEVRRDPTKDSTWTFENYPLPP